MEEKMTQYDHKTSATYSRPEMKNFFHRKYITYPSWLTACGDVKDTHILDLGCGSGRSSRLLARQGAKIVGLDNSQVQLYLAKTEEEKNPLGIEYVFGEASDLSRFKKFDMVTAAMLLHYAQSEEQLVGMCIEIARVLVERGRLVTLTLCPKHPVQAYHPLLGYSSEWVGRAFQNGSEIKITLYDSKGGEVGGFSNWYWDAKTYEKALVHAGFRNIEWSRCTINTEGKSLLLTSKLYDLNFPEIENKMVLSVLSATIS
ncbi:MAG: Methyltransferase type 11 [Parcubacteria group bacterium GW2011_GWC2_42_11]|nr:MAG: Methyltransferase type 11 [Parcubacteria group bacterium GW2011_GWC2_42_11]